MYNHSSWKNWTTSLSLLMEYVTQAGRKQGNTGKTTKEKYYWVLGMYNIISKKFPQLMWHLARET